MRRPSWRVVVGALVYLTLAGLIALVVVSLIELTREVQATRQEAAMRGEQRDDLARAVEALRGQLLSLGETPKIGPPAEPIPGPVGDRGERGVPGRDGRSVVGPAGPAPPGPMPSPIPGPPGRDGRDGKDGKDGGGLDHPRPTRQGRAGRTRRKGRGGRQPRTVAVHLHPTGGRSAHVRLPARFTVALSVTPEHHPRICAYCLNGLHLFCLWSYGCECGCPTCPPFQLTTQRESA